jgi:hypothetical protein
VGAVCITLAHLHNSFINTTFCIKPSTGSNIVTISDTHTYIVMSDMSAMITTTDHLVHHRLLLCIPTFKNRISLHPHLQRIIYFLKAKDSSGYDGVSTNILKMCNSLISKPLSYICNKSIQTGVFPDRLKYAIWFHLNLWLKPFIIVLGG